MKSAELKKKKDNDLMKLLSEKKEELRERSFAASGAAKSGSNKDVRKDIARILTELNARSSAPAETK